MFAEMGEQGFVFEKADVQFVSDVVFEQDEYRCYTQSMNVMKMNNILNKHLKENVALKNNSLLLETSRT